MTNTVDSQRDNRMAWALRRVQAPEPEIDSMVEALKRGTKAHVAKVESLFTHSQVWEGFTAHTRSQALQFPGRRQGRGTGCMPPVPSLMQNHFRVRDLGPWESVRRL